MGHFDCHSTDELEQDESLRNWQSGGPFGAGWNLQAWPLACKVRIHAPCSAKLHVQLFGNGHVFAGETRRVEQGTFDWGVELPVDVWATALTQRNADNEVLVFSVGGVLFCEDGSEHLPFADAFTAGFAAGE